MVLKKIKNVKRYLAELCEGDGNGSKTAPTPVNSAETCTEEMRAPDRPGRKNETPRSGRPQATWPTAGAGKATGAKGDYTAVGRGSAARSRATPLHRFFFFPLFFSFFFSHAADEKLPRKRGKEMKHGKTTLPFGRSYHCRDTEGLGEKNETFFLFLALKPFFCKNEPSASKPL